MRFNFLESQVMKDKLLGARYRVVEILVVALVKPTSLKTPIDRAILNVSSSTSSPLVMTPAFFG